MASTKNATASWGVSSTVDAVSGIIVDIQRTEEPLLYSETDTGGAVVGQYMYDRRCSISFVVMVAATTDAPKGGDSLSVSGKMYYVMNAQIVESNRAFRKIQISAERYEKCEAAADCLGSI